MIGTDVRTTMNEIDSFERTAHSSYLLSVITPTTQTVNEIQVLKIVIPDSSIDRNMIQNYRRCNALAWNSIDRNIFAAGYE